VRRNPATRNLPVLLVEPPGGTAGRAVGGRDAPDEILVSSGPLDAGLLEARITAMLERIAGGRQDEPGVTGRVVAVTSAKGGAGVSHVAANLALALALPSDRSVVAVDLDLQYGDLPMLLDVRRATGIDELAASLAVDGDEVAPEDHLARHGSGLRVLASPQTPVDALRIDEAVTTHVLARLRALHDLLIVDVPPGFGDPALVALTRADRIVVIVVPEVTALVRTLRLLGVLRSLDIPEERLLLVFNRTVDSRDLPRDRVEEVLERPMLVDIPHDLALFHRATTTGRPVVDLVPDHPVSRELRRLAQMVG
jgi:pilus assembly protein CpaE